MRGADVAGRRVLLIDDAIASGSAVERFTAALAAAGAEVAGVFVLVDMREVADTVSGVAAALPTEAVSSYLQVLDLATTHGVLDPAVHELSLDAILNRWSDDDRGGICCPRRPDQPAANGDCACASRPSAAYRPRRGASRIRSSREYRRSTRTTYGRSAS